MRRTALFRIAPLLSLALLQGPPVLATTPQANPGVNFDGLVDFLKQPGRETPKELVHGTSRYEIQIHAPSVAPLIQPLYNLRQLELLENSLGATMALRTDVQGLVRASDRLENPSGVGAGKADPTHYDAVWVRDSLWAYLALEATPAQKKAARRLLLTLTDYFASVDQIRRMERVIHDPTLLDGPDGSMNAVHIRFDSRSSGFEDVKEGGKPQKWNHKQNDALGLFLDLFCRAALSSEITAKDITPARVKAVSLLPRYLNSVKFYKMEDAGSWEEIERVNTSSIALVTSGLERMKEALDSKTPAARAFSMKLRNAGGLTSKELKDLIDHGYDRIFKQLKAGGESPLYASTDPRYRTADAALLNLIYPAKLHRLQRDSYDRVISIIEPLIGPVGIKRYYKDSYQSGNFWYNDWPGMGISPSPKPPAKSKTDNTSSATSFQNRSKQFLPDSEAQWFFDSWYSTAMGRLFERYHDLRYRELEIKHLNRALAQITGGTLEQPTLGADGKPVQPMALPESYNTIVDPRTGGRYFAPSPITPLNWAKASLKLALQQLRANQR